jgi:putative SOS response-associated peptidase YedK
MLKGATKVQRNDHTIWALISNGGTTIHTCDVGVRERSNLASKKQCDLHCCQERSKETRTREWGIVPTFKASKTNDPNFFVVRIEDRWGQFRSSETFGSNEVHPIRKEI